MLHADASCLFLVDENANANKKYFRRGKALQQPIQLQQAVGRSGAADDGDF